MEVVLTLQIKDTVVIKASLNGRLLVDCIESLLPAML